MDFPLPNQIAIAASSDREAKEDDESTDLGGADPRNLIFTFFSPKELCRLQSVSSICQKSCIFVISRLKSLPPLLLGLEEQTVTKYCKNLREAYLGRLYKKNDIALAIITEILEKNNKLSTLCVAFDAPFQLIASKAQALSSLELSGARYFEFSDIIPIMESRGAQIKTFKLCCCGDGIDGDFTDIAPFLPNLEELVLDGVVFDQAKLQYLFQGAKRLRNLELAGFDQDVVGFESMKLLTRLCLAEFDEESSIARYFTFPNLKTFNCMVDGSTPVDISCFAKMAPNLKELYVGGDVTGLASVFKGCKSLEVLHFSSSGHDMDFALASLRKECVLLPGLVELSGAFSPECLSMLGSVAPNLKTLVCEFYDCNRAYDVLVYSSSVCNSGLLNLEKLVVRLRCTSEVLQCFTETALPKLRVLWFGFSRTPALIALRRQLPDCIVNVRSKYEIG